MTQMPQRGRAGAICVLLFVAACSQTPSSQPAVATTTRPVGAWQGAGTMTVGDVVNTAGHFLITWDAKNERPPGGHFRLTVQSGVSGRALKTVVDHAGEGHGLVEFHDDPRVYQFLVESSNVDWSFSVDEIVAVPDPGTPRP